MNIWLKLSFYLFFSGGIFITCLGIYYKKAYLANKSLFGPFNGKKAIAINLILLAADVFGLRVAFFGNSFDWTFFILTLVLWIVFGLVFIRKQNF